MSAIRGKEFLGREPEFRMGIMSTGPSAPDVMANPTSAIFDEGLRVALFHSNSANSLYDTVEHTYDASRSGEAKARYPRHIIARLLMQAAYDCWFIENNKKLARRLLGQLNSPYLRKDKLSTHNLEMTLNSIFVLMRKKRKYDNPEQEESFRELFAEVVKGNDQINMNVNFTLDIIAKEAKARVDLASDLLAASILSEEE